MWWCGTLASLVQKAFALQPSVSQSFNLSLTPTHGWDKAYCKSCGSQQLSPMIPVLVRPCLSVKAPCKTKELKAILIKAVGREQRIRHTDTIWTGETCDSTPLVLPLGHKEPAIICYIVLLRDRYSCSWNLCLLSVVGVTWLRPPKIPWSWYILITAIQIHRWIIWWIQTFSLLKDTSKEF